MKKKKLGLRVASVIAVVACVIGALVYVASIHTASGEARVGRDGQPAISDGVVFPSSGAPTSEPTVKSEVPVEKNPKVDKKVVLPAVKKPNAKYPYSHPIGFTSKNKTVALTFDDGPGSYTLKVLKILKKYDVKATFCMIGVNVTNYPEIAREVVRDGHQLCNHSYVHDRKVNLSGSGVVYSDVEKTNEIFESKLGVMPVFYRAPEGLFHGGVPGALREARMIPLGWSVDSEDWRKPGVSKIVSNVVSNTNGNNIILFHDGGGVRSETVAALPTIIEKLKVKGYKFVLPENLVDEKKSKKSVDDKKKSVKSSSGSR